MWHKPHHIQQRQEVETLLLSSVDSINQSSTHWINSYSKIPSPRDFHRLEATPSSRVSQHTLPGCKVSACGKLSLWTYTTLLTVTVLCVQVARYKLTKCMISHTVSATTLPQTTTLVHQTTPTSFLNNHIPHNMNKCTLRIKCLWTCFWRLEDAASQGRRQWHFKLKLFMSQTVLSPIRFNSGMVLPLSGIWFTETTIIISFLVKCYFLYQSCAWPVTKCVLLPSLMCHRYCGHFYQHLNTIKGKVRGFISEHYNHVPQIHKHTLLKYNINYI